MSKVALFIDGASMFYAQKQSGWHIDFRSLYKFFTRGKEIYGAFYFASAPPKTDSKALQRYRRFRQALIAIGYHVIDKEVKTLIDPKTGQTRVSGSLDVELTLRMLAGSDSYDEAVLLGGDLDYLPVVHHLRTRGKTITIVNRKEMTSTELINATDKFVDLNGLKDYIEKGKAPMEAEDIPLPPEEPLSLLKPSPDVKHDRSAELLRLHPLILKASTRAYITENYDSAVLNAFKVVEKYVKEKSGLRLFGQQLMARAFDEQNPVLRLNPLDNESERMEQLGYKFLFMGMVGIRDLLAHEVVEWRDPEKAFKFLAFCSLLLEKIDEALG